MFFSPSPWKPEKVAPPAGFEPGPNKIVAERSNHYATMTGEHLVVAWQTIAEERHVGPGSNLAGRDFLQYILNFFAHWHKITDRMCSLNGPVHNDFVSIDLRGVLCSPRL